MMDCKHCITTRPEARAELKHSRLSPSAVPRSTLSRSDHARAVWSSTSTLETSRSLSVAVPFDFTFIRMEILCVICQDQFSSSDDIFFTRCGHVFHHRCLLQWLEKSKTCPQCRNRVTIEKIHKAHFTVSNTEIAANNVNNSTLQGKIDSLQFQILLNEKNIKYYTSKNTVLEKQNAGLRQEVRKVESEMRQKNSTIYDLKEKINYFRANYQERDVLKRKLSQKEREVEQFRDMYKTLSTGTLEDVQEMIGKTTDRNTLINYISMMKKLMLKKTEKIVNLENQLTLHQQSLDKDLNFALCESENLALRHRVNELEKLLTSDQNYISRSNNRRCSNSLITIKPQNTKQETAGQNNSSTSEAEVEIIETNQDNSIPNSTLDECPTVTKKARLGLQSGNNSEKTNDVHEDNVTNTAGISSQSNVKTSLKKRNFRVIIN
ncbi:PREDICTED: E3 ubiquitin-protein ligase TRAIP-like [Trachymyrmex cornetzi]|uniref:E3 ubiquitin-protein ligase TRAIP-like n=1 Tax=Trachymyrmex cornetzi TaxID=471704 RepID=UPI00084F5C0B|nr:PREDICTED: E3 ubiquitin-protein ligase TRAIP-like [Trachymyrmex cornetzi]